MKLCLCQTLENQREEARAYSNLGSAYHSQRDFDKAISYHTRVLELAQEQGDRSIEMRAYAGLGHAARCMQVSETIYRITKLPMTYSAILSFLCAASSVTNPHIFVLGSTGPGEGVSVPPTSASNCSGAAGQSSSRPSLFQPG